MFKKLLLFMLMGLFSINTLTIVPIKAGNHFPNVARKIADYIDRSSYEILEINTVLFDWSDQGSPECLEILGIPECLEILAEANLFKKTLGLSDRDKSILMSKINQGVPIKKIATETKKRYCHNLNLIYYKYLTCLAKRFENDENRL